MLKASQLVSKSVKIIKNLKNNYFVLFLFSFSVIARLWYFWQPSFSGDEAAYMGQAVSVARGIADLLTFSNVQAGLKNTFFTIWAHNHAPLEFFILIPAVIFESREFWARFIYVFFNILVLTAGYFYLRKIRNQQVALGFLVFFGTSIYVIWWSQVAMYLSLAMASGVFITIALANFVARPQSKNLVYLALATVFGLLVFPDFIFYTPALLWAVWDKRNYLKIKNLTLPILILLFPLVVFYIPWVIYAFVGHAQGAGFNYVINYKLALQANIAGNIRSYWNNVFSYQGVITAWPFALLSAFNLKTIKYAKYLFLVILIYLFVYIVKSHVAFYYFVSILGPLFIIAADALTHFKNYVYRILLAVTVINIIGAVPLFKGVHNPFILGVAGKRTDHVREVGDIAKKCLTGQDETYISSHNAWKTAYYFGKRSLLERDGDEARLATISLFLEGQADSVKLIHYNSGQVEGQIEGELAKRAAEILNFGNEKVFLFKKC